MSTAQESSEGDTDQDLDTNMMVWPKGETPAQQILLNQTKLQDSIVTFLQYIPSLIYIIVSLVYAPVMFTISESAIRSVWIAFSLMLILVGLLFSYHALNALHARNTYEAVSLKTPSSSVSTAERIWRDRLEEAKLGTQHQFKGIMVILYNSIEMLTWLGFAAVIYWLARH